MACWHAREKKGRRADPSLVVLDTQSVHAAAPVPADTTARDAVTAHASTVSTALAGQGFKNAVIAHGAALGIDVQVVERNPSDTGFVPQPKRWVVEQTLGILSFHRRLVRDYEHTCWTRSTRGSRH